MCRACPRHNPATNLRFRSEREAGATYDRAAQLLLGADAVFNFEAGEVDAGGESAMWQVATAIHKAMGAAAPAEVKHLAAAAVLADLGVKGCWEPAAAAGAAVAGGAAGPRNAPRAWAAGGAHHAPAAGPTVATRPAEAGAGVFGSPGSAGSDGTAMRKRVHAAFKGASPLETEQDVGRYQSPELSWPMAVHRIVPPAHLLLPSLLLPGAPAVHGASAPRYDQPASTEHDREQPGDNGWFAPDDEGAGTALGQFPNHRFQQQRVPSPATAAAQGAAAAPLKAQPLLHYWPEARLQQGGSADSERARGTDDAVPAPVDWLLAPSACNFPPPSPGHASSQGSTPRSRVSPNLGGSTAEAGAPQSHTCFGGLSAATAAALAEFEALLQRAPDALLAALHCAVTACSAGDDIAAAAAAATAEIAARVVRAVLHERTLSDSRGAGSPAG